MPQTHNFTISLAEGIIFTNVLMDFVSQHFKTEIGITNDSLSKYTNSQPYGPWTFRETEGKTIVQ